MTTPREYLEGFQKGIGELQRENGAMVKPFMNMLGHTFIDKALTNKTKELISIGIACYSRCEYCIVYHTYKCLEAGATKEEIFEAAMVSVAFGGGPSMAYSATLLNDCIKEFAGDFKK